MNPNKRCDTIKPTVATREEAINNIYLLLYADEWIDNVPFYKPIKAYPTLKQAKEEFGRLLTYDHIDVDDLKIRTMVVEENDGPF